MLLWSALHVNSSIVSFWRFELKLLFNFVRLFSSFLLLYFSSTTQFVSSLYTPLQLTYKCSLSIKLCMLLLLTYKWSFHSSSHTNWFYPKTSAMYATNSAFVMEPSSQAGHQGWRTGLILFKLLSVMNLFWMQQRTILAHRGIVIFLSIVERKCWIEKMTVL